MGVQGVQERAEHTALGSSGVKGQRGGGDVAHPYRLASARRELQDPAARRTGQTQIPKGLNIIVAKRVV